MAGIRIRTTKRERNAIKREIKRLVDDNLVGTGKAHLSANRIASLVTAQRGMKGLPKVFGGGCVEYFFRQMLKDGDIFIKEDQDGEAYLVTKEHPDKTLEEAGKNNININNINKASEVENKMKINVKDANDVKADKRFAELVENKIQKSIRNTREFKAALNRALQGGFDEDIDDATGADLLKVVEKWSIRKIFSLETGKDYYKLYKEVYYIEDPHKYYFEVVNPTIYRRISAQHEQGDIEWAKSVSEHENIPIINE